MAFNPFSNFRKYRTFWMATILLLCMVTFVLCTGFGQGDLSDLMLRIFRSRGSAWAKLDDRSIYQSEFLDLRDRRNTANEFMHTASKFCMTRMDEVLKPENFKKVEQNPKEREGLLRVQQLRNRLETLNRKPRYFDSGVKADELMDFKIWLAEAERLGIDVDAEIVRKLVMHELVLGNDQFYPPETFKGTALEMRRNNPRANEAYVTSALRDEFRVRLAQRVLAGGGEPRIALTPAQIWDAFKEKRAEYRISLLPLHVEDFVRDVKTPDDETLRIYFEQYKSQPFDPTSDKPGFAIPNRVKVAWIAGDPQSDYFKKLSKLAIDLQTTPVLPAQQLPAFSFLLSNRAKIGAAESQFENLTRGQFRMYGPMQSGAPLAVAEYLSERDPFAVAALISGGARLDAGIATLPSYLATGMIRHPNEFAAGAKDILNKRAPLYASFAMLGATHQGLAIPFAWDKFYLMTDYLPLSVIQKELLQTIERNQADLWVRQHMQAIKKDLEKIPLPSAVQIQTRLTDYVRKQLMPAAKSAGKAEPKSLALKEIGLEQGETKTFYNKFDIQDAKELEPLKKSYLAYYTNINNAEGRSLTPDRVLKADDFWKLFFSEAGEPFSATGKFQIRPWPPAVRIEPQEVQRARFDPRNPRIAAMAANLGANEPLEIQFFNDAERPILFWRTADEPGGIAKDWTEVRDRVIATWKLDKARENIVLPRAQKIALEIQKNAAPVLTMLKAMEDLKKDFGVKQEIISLNQVSPLVPKTGGGGFGMPRAVTAYVDFELEPGLIKYPRTDTAANLLGLYDLKKEIKIDFPSLDNINKTLYNEISKEKNPQGKFVQILTNQARDVLYVAAVRDAPAPNRFDFNMAVREAASHDQFFDRSMVDASKKLRDEIMEQLRKAHKLERPTEEVKKGFDHDTTN